MADYSGPKKLDPAVDRENLGSIVDVPYAGEQIREKYGLDANASEDSNEYNMLYDQDDDL